MPEIIASESQPFEHWKEGATEPPLSSLKGRVKAHPVQFPVDESEDFYDPFSELSLFLAKKIKTEIEKNGSSREWSSRIESDLMKNILPEFKVKFPRYRLGVFAVKKTFEKVAFYYEKLSSKKEALSQDGKVNTSYMIRENLRDLLHHKSSYDLYPHNEAHRIAIKVSECIATLDGERLPLEALTARIWASLKHLVPGTKSGAIKSPFEQFDERDKLIVKALIETEASYPCCTYEQLREEIAEKLSVYRTLPSPQKTPKLSNLTHALIAKGFARAGGINLPENELDQLDIYLKEREARGESSHAIVQRLMKIHEMHQNAAKTQGAPLLEYLHLQIWLMEEEEAEVLKDLARLQAMPTLSAMIGEELEILVWSRLESTERAKAAPELLKLLEIEITAQALTLKNPNYRSLVTQTLLFFRKAKETASDVEGLDEKIDLWAMQGELIYACLHFDSQSPFLLECQNLKGQPLTAIVSSFLSKNSYLTPFAVAMELHASIYEKYIWYHMLSSEGETSYDRFIKRHAETEHLELLIRDKFPLIPFCPNYAQDQINPCDE